MRSWRTAATTRKLEAAFRELLAGRPSAQAFTTERLSALSTVVSKDTWRQVAAYGPLQSFAFVEDDTSASAKTRALRYKAALGPRLVLLRFALDEDGKVAEINVEEEE